MRQMTLCLPLSENNIVLGLKKEGFGAGFYNGFGGKVKEGETIEEAAIRELLEETSVEITPSKLKKTAELSFKFPHKPEWDCLVHAFIISQWEGNFQESREMKPIEFPISALPFNRMWQADKIWIPLILEEKFVKATFTYGENGEVIKHSIE